MNPWFAFGLVVAILNLVFQSSRIFIEKFTSYTCGCDAFMSKFRNASMRTYAGHSKAVRDVSFSNDGARFLSAGFDGNVRYWDTETGQALSTFSSTGNKVIIPYVARLNPDEDKQHILLAGMSDGKVVQWDVRSPSSSSSSSGKMKTQKEYDQHLGAVNTVTFIDGNRRFVTSSDDRTLRVWDFGIPVPIKLVAEPEMHAVPSVAAHPGGDWMAAQSLDGRIRVYSTKEKERFRMDRDKSFGGHDVAGYACQVSFSPDGRLVMSGDGAGRCWWTGRPAGACCGDLSSAMMEFALGASGIPWRRARLQRVDGMVSLDTGTEEVWRRDCSSLPGKKSCTSPIRKC